MSDYEEVAKSIEDMVVQGAGDIAITAGYGLYLAARYVESIAGIKSDEAQEYLVKVRERLENTRPTGYHMKVLLRRLIDQVDWKQPNWSEKILKRIDKIIKQAETRSN